MIIENQCSMRYYGVSQSQECNNDNNYNDDNVMRASVWLVYFGANDPGEPAISNKRTG